MPSFLSHLKLRDVAIPVRRVLALDAGSRSLKLLLAESNFGRLRLLKQEALDLQTEGLLSADELKSYLETMLGQCGNPPLAIILPEHVSTSQVIDVPVAPESESEKLIGDEIVKLSGVSETRIIYDFVRIESPLKNRRQFWVTLCQEGDIRERIARLGVEHEAICEVTTAANALIAAYRRAAPLSARAVLVHLGAQSTIVVVVLAGQGAFCASFQMGGSFFTRALARVQNCPEETAELLKREQNLLTGPNASPEMLAVVDGWAIELQRQLLEWFKSNPALAAEGYSFQWVASGAGFEQPGLLEYLQRKPGLKLEPWPKVEQPHAVSPAKGFEIAFGAAWQALGSSPQPVSLLPDDYRAAWKKRLVRQRIEFASLGLALLCVLLLAIGTWHKLSLISTKESLRTKVRAAQEAVEANESLSADLLTEYENLRPLFASQQNTIDTLRTLDLLQQSRSNRPYFYVLLADQQSYFSRPPAQQSTNRPVATNLLGPTIDWFRSSLFPLRATASASTNGGPGKPGLIAELCVPGEAEAARQVLSELVKDLKHAPLFSKVDLLLDDLRRNLADPKVLVPDRDYVLALDFAETDFQQPLPAKRTVAGPSRGGSKRPSRLNHPGPDASARTLEGTP